MRAGRLAVVLGSLTSVNILLAFVYQWYLVTVLGAGVQMDALVAGIEAIHQEIPNPSP